MPDCTDFLWICEVIPGVIAVVGVGFGDANMEVWDMKHPAVYLMASGVQGTLYIGVTSDLVQRVWQHREGVIPGFTQRYGVKRLVWYERHESMEAAILREKALKKWQRAWKVRLIEESNLPWRDLWTDICGEATPPGSPRSRG